MKKDYYTRLFLKQYYQYMLYLDLQLLPPPKKNTLIINVLCMFFLCKQILFQANERAVLYNDLDLNNILIVDYNKQLNTQLI